MITRPRHQNTFLATLILLTLLCLPFTSNAAPELNARGQSDYGALGISLCNKYNTDRVILPFLTEAKSRSYAAINGGRPPLALCGRS